MCLVLCLAVTGAVLGGKACKAAYDNRIAEELEQAIERDAASLRAAALERIRLVLWCYVQYFAMFSTFSVPRLAAFWDLLVV